MLTPYTFHSRQHGFSLLEVLVSLVLMSIGLLGIARFSLRVQNGELEATQRTQAAILVEDMAQRIYANSTNAANYVTGTSSPNSLGTGDSQPSTCNTLAVGVLRDKCEWSNALKGALEKSNGGTNVGGVLGAIGCVQQIQAPQPSPACLPGVYMVSVAWQGLSRSVTPAGTCGQGAFGAGANDAARRLISTQVTIGTGSC